MRLSDEQHAVIDKAASLMSPRLRATFLMHVRAGFDATVTDAQFVALLVESLGRFGVSVGPGYFRAAHKAHHAASANQSSGRDARATDALAAGQNRHRI
jgi:hypothetical protein